MELNRKLEIYKLNKRIVNNRNRKFKSADTWGIDTWDLFSSIKGERVALGRIKREYIHLFQFDITDEQLINQLIYKIKGKMLDINIKTPLQLSYATTLQGYICYLQGKKTHVGDIYKECKKRLPNGNLEV